MHFEDRGSQAGQHAGGDTILLTLFEVLHPKPSYEIYPSDLL